MDKDELKCPAATLNPEASPVHFQGEGPTLEVGDEDEPKHREYHPSLNGMPRAICCSCVLQPKLMPPLAHPCNEHGEYLLKDSAPPPCTDAQFGDWGPFTGRVEFELAKFLFQREQMLQSNLLDLWAADVLKYGGHPPFSDHAELYQLIDAIHAGDVPWTCLKVSYNGAQPDGDAPSWMDETYEIWFRVPRRVALKMLANPDFEGLFDMVPYREFTVRGEQRYGSLMSANWSWKQAVSHGSSLHCALLTSTPWLLGSHRCGGAGQRWRHACTSRVWQQQDYCICCDGSEQVLPNVYVSRKPPEWSASGS